MKKYFSIFAFVLLLVTQVYGQAAVDIPITVKDNHGHWQILNFGLDLTATNSIDPWLGESDPPPYPPPYAFDARWWLPPFYGALSSWKDYRPPGNPPVFPFSGTIQYSVKFQDDSLGWPIIISWNLPSEIAPTSTIQDIGGGSIINKEFFGADSIVVTDPTIGQLHVFVDYDNIIPVELISFNASVLEKVVQLSWTTATETNNSGFEINRKKLEARSQESEWNVIGFVPGFGTTTEPKSYSFTDEDVTTGTYKYRLKQIDFDGSFEYSNEIEVEVDFAPKEFVLYQNYPNPFNPKTVISYQLPVSGNVTLKVYDVLGNEVATLVNEKKQPGVYEVEFDSHSDEGQNLSSGIYFYTLKAGSFSHTKKMILAK